MLLGSNLFRAIKWYNEIDSKMTAQTAKTQADDCKNFWKNYFGNIEVEISRHPVFHSNSVPTQAINQT